MRWLRWMILGGGLVGLLSGCAPEPQGRPHLILVTADTLRPDHLSMNGYVRETSPNLDAFALEADWFENAITPIPKTGPSFATMFTGEHPQTHGVRFNFVRLPNELPLLAERLQAAGYRTAAFVSNPVLRKGVGFERGFETFEIFPKDDGLDAQQAAFEAWSESAFEEPTFVWIHYIDPHGPYEPPAEYEALFLDDEHAQIERRVPLDAEAARQIHNPNKLLGALPAYQRREDGEDRWAKFVARYDAEIRYMDAMFGRTIERLRQLGVYDRSIVGFTSDHGESLGEHDYYFEHGWFAFDATLRIPLLLKAPGQQGGRRIPTQVSTLDLAPTLLAMVGLVGSSSEGVDLRNSALEERPIVIENSDQYPLKYLGVRTSDWKYLYTVQDGSEELYRLTADSGEVDNLIREEPGRARQLRRELERRLKKLRQRQFEAQAGNDDEASLEDLRRLGYVDEH